MDRLNDRIGLARDLLALSQTMLEMAQAGRWDALEGLDKQRGHIIAVLFADVEPGDMDDDHLISMLHEARICGDTLLALVAQERDRFGRELRDMRNARKAELIYANVLDEAVLE